MSKTPLLAISSKICFTKLEFVHTEMGESDIAILALLCSYFVFEIIQDAYVYCCAIPVQRWYRSCQAKDHTSWYTIHCVMVTPRMRKISLLKDGLMRCVCLHACLPLCLYMCICVCMSVSVCLTLWPATSS